MASSVPSCHEARKLHGRGILALQWDATEVGGDIREEDDNRQEAHHRECRRTLNYFQRQHDRYTAKDTNAVV
jgi:hypothetical protein